MKEEDVDCGSRLFFNKIYPKISYNLSPPLEDHVELEWEFN